VVAGGGQRRGNCGYLSLPSSRALTHDRAKMWPCARPKPCTFHELSHDRDAAARRRRGPVGRAEDAASHRRPGHDRVLRAPRLRLSADTDYAPETDRFCLPLAIGSRKRRRSDRSAGSKRPKTLERMDWSGKPDSNRRPSAWERAQRSRQSVAADGRRQKIGRLASAVRTTVRPLWESFACAKPQ